jgi:Mrp family chromosome partitioning ATPase
VNVSVLTAISGAWEAPLVSALESRRTGVTVVRRCVDLADLLAAASAGGAQAVLLSADLRHLDRESLSMLSGSGVAVVGVYAPAEPQQSRRLATLGVAEVVSADAPAEDVAAAVTRAVLSLGETPAQRDRHAIADPAAALPRPRSAGSTGAGPRHEPERRGSGRLIAVWGPAGSPGRTTVAVTLAAELAALGESTLLVDADTYAASIAQTVGVLDEAPGLAAACRSASAGTLDATVLARLAPQLAPHLRILTGVSRSSRWPEISGSALTALWPVARQVAAWTVVDCGFCLERDEELSYDTSAPRRNAATLVTLEQADVVLAVGAADPVGLQRLVRGLSELSDVVPTASPHVVVTKVRASAVGAGPARRITDALGRYAGISSAVMVPDDRAACDAALLAGRTLTEAARSSPARRAVAELAAGLAHRAPKSRAARRAAERELTSRGPATPATPATPARAQHLLGPTGRGRMAG